MSGRNDGESRNHLSTSLPDSRETAESNRVDTLALVTNPSKDAASRRPPLVPQMIRAVRPLRHLNRPRPQPGQDLGSSLSIFDEVPAIAERVGCGSPIPWKSSEPLHSNRETVPTPYPTAPVRKDRQTAQRSGRKAPPHLAPGSTRWRTTSFHPVGEAARRDAILSSAR